MDIDILTIESNSNFETPHRLVGADGRGYMELTDQELVFFMAEWLRFNLTSPVLHERKTVGYEFHLRKA